MKSIFKVIRWLFVAALASFGLYVLLQTALHNGSQNNVASPVVMVAEPGIDPKAVARSFLQKHEQVINECAQKDMRSLEDAIRSLNSYFDQKKVHVDEMVEELFSYKSKGYMAWYYVKGDGALDKYLQEVTQKHLGSPQGLETTMTGILASLKMNLTKNHNELMLAVEADIATLPYTLNIRSVSGEKFAGDFHNAFDKTLGDMLGQTVGTQIGVEAIGFAIDAYVSPVLGAAVVTALVERGLITGGAMAAEGTVVGTSAGLAPYTFGASLVIGGIIALGVDIICNHFAEDSARQKITASLDGWKASTVLSFKNNLAGGIRSFQDARAKALREALIQQISNNVRS